MIRPSFPDDADEEDIAAVMKRSAIVLFTDMFV